MVKDMKRILVGIVLLFLLVGCSNTSPDKIMKLERGMSLRETVSTLGEPYTKMYRTDGYVLMYRYRDGGMFHELEVYIENGKVNYWR